MSQENKIVIVQGQLSKIIHQQGQGGFPQKGQQVHALYRGTLEDGTQFDSNQNRDSPFKFTIGQGQVIKGWDQGFATMKVGQKATLICSPDYAYGKRGSPPRIPANATLHFQVQLLGFNDKQKDKWEMSDQQKVSEATKLKNQGNESLKEGKFQEAVKKYQKALDYVQGQQCQGAAQITKVIKMNLSQACLKAKQFGKSIRFASQVLQKDCNNVKTLYRRGLAYKLNADFQLAKKDMEKLLQIEPQNNDAKLQLQNINNLKKQADQKQKKMFGSMFSKSGLYEDKKVSEVKAPQPVENQSDGEQMPELEKQEQNKQ